MLDKSQRLRAGHIRCVFHLLGELVELGRDPSQWRTHLLQRLLALVDGRLGLAAEHFICPDAPKMVGLVEVGWEPAEQQLFYSHVNAGGMANDPLHEPVQRLLHRSFTRRRRDLVPDEIWYASPTVVVRQQCNIDDQIYSRWNLPQSGWAHIITPMRAWGARPFGVRDRFIVSLLHRELGRLWSQVDRGHLAQLPPRLRQTLDLLFCGYSEKEMATALNLSRHTVHDFTRRLYRHFNVSGRGELLTQPSSRQLMFRPALSPAYYAHERGDNTGTFPAVEA